MPRPKSIPWEKRVSVFLDYRRERGKVNRVANRHRIARSTVNVIVNEFLDMGFTDRPRAKLSEEWLSQMQEQHLSDVWNHRGNTTLNLGPGTDNEEGRQAAAANPLPIEKNFAWHLRGTKGEEVIQEAANAVRDYLSRESEAWSKLRIALEEICQLPEKEDSTIQDPEPHLLATLKRRLRSACFDSEFQGQPPPPNWLQWDVAPDNPRVLRLQGEYVAIGDPDDHQVVRQGVAAFLANSFRDHQRCFVEVEGLRKDMGIMNRIVNETLESIDESEIRQGICPGCPYPEARSEPVRDPGRTNRSAKEE